MNENMWSRHRIRQQDPLMVRDFVRRDRSYTLGATVENRQAPTFLPGLEESCRNSVFWTSQALTKARRSGEGCYRLNSGSWGSGVSRRHSGNVCEEMERKGGKLKQII